LPIPLKVAVNGDNEDNGTKLKNCIQIMIRPNGADNKERDVIAAVNVTSWMIHHHIIS